MTARGVGMNLVAFIVVALLPLRATCDEPREIPLKDIWAYKMPGTRDVRELEPKPEIAATIDEMARRSEVWKILKFLDRRPKEGEKAGPAFVVVGTGNEALKNASAVFIPKHKTRLTILPPETDLSLVFYSFQSGRYGDITESWVL